MPGRPPKPCAYPGCPQLTERRFCSTHLSFRRKERDSRRPNSTRRGYGYRWRRARAAYLRQNPLCDMCLKENRYEPATVVDHIVLHRGDVELFWNQDNWQALCKCCHDRKTGKEGGRFGKFHEGERKR